MNRRDFLKNTSKSILAGLFGAFIVAEESGRKQLEWQLSEEKECPDCECFNRQCFCGVDVAKEGGDMSGVLVSKNDKIELWGLSEGDTSEILDHINEFYMKAIALGMGVSQEDIC